jgi:hypothetical protein
MPSLKDARASLTEHQREILDFICAQYSRQVLEKGDAAPKTPLGGKVKTVPIARIFRNKDLG